MTVLISSHDLAEIETFATDVGYLDGGRLIFAEEIATLTRRFREVTVVLGEGSAPEPVLAKPPSSWLVPERSASTLRFVHSQAIAEPLEQQVAALVPHATRIDAEPMPLRSIFLALARSADPRPFAHPAGDRS